MVFTIKNYKSVISLELAKSFLRIEGGQDDSFVSFLISSAESYAEDKLGMTIGTKDYIMQCVTDSCYITIPRTNLTKVEYVKVDGIESEFELYCNIVKIQEGVKSKNVEIAFSCNNENVSDFLKTTLLRHVYFLYENRGEFNFKPIEEIYNVFMNGNYKI